MLCDFSDLTPDERMREIECMRSNLTPAMAPGMVLDVDPSSTSVAGITHLEHMA